MKEDPENVEAKYFYAYYSLYEGKNGELTTRFSTLCKTLTSSLKMIKTSSETKEEQLKIIREITDSFVPETWALNRFMNKKNTESKVGDHYVQVFSSSDLTLCGRKGLQTLKELGDTIYSLYPDDPDCGAIAVIAWKEFVSLAQKWYSWAEKGDAEVYAEKIKKIDPSYIMPKKAGCISFADKK